MQLQTLLALLVTIAIALAGFVAVHVLRRRNRNEAAASETEPSALAIASGGDDPPPPPIPFATEATEEATGQVLKLAFGVSRFDYQILDEHAAVLDMVDRALDEAAETNQYFPRRPLLLPKLLQALNDSDSTRRELVRLLLEDPALAGTTLKRANNAFYRLGPAPVESLDRAVAVLGIEGLRSLLSTAILQPVFRLPKGFFDRFAELCWEQAQRCSVCAQTHAEKTAFDDPFIAQLLGVLRSLATLVLFRLTLDKYHSLPNAMPRAEVFIQVLRKHRGRLAIDIAKTWQLSDVSINALEEQTREVSPVDMTALGRSIYYGELAGILGVAIHHALYSAEGALTILVDQGLTPELADTLLTAAKAADS
jgi:HD-like signal output (HDOD) protein